MSGTLDPMTSPCERCGFTAEDYSTRDLATAPDWLAGMATDAMEGVDDDVLGSASVAANRTELDRAIADLGRGGELDHAGRGAIVHRGIHAVRELGRTLHEAGAGARSHQGRVAQVNLSGGGAPKSAVPAADVGLRGLVGDRQANRKHHGRPFQALCLFSTEIIEALRAEGHPVEAGSTGENLTLSGVDWTAIRPGTRLLIGQVLCEISAWATPCRNIDSSFLQRSDRIDHDVNPGWSRAYAWVIEGGTVAVGDTVVVEP